MLSFLLIKYTYRYMNTLALKQNKTNPSRSKSQSKLPTSPRKTTGSPTSSQKKTLRPN